MHTVVYSHAKTFGNLLLRVIKNHPSIFSIHKVIDALVLHSDLCLLMKPKK